MKPWICALILALTVPLSGAEKPNILFIIADDLGWADVGYHGSEIRTPNIDQLAKAGLQLHQHYVTPMCSSTRACLLSGRYCTRFGIEGATNDLVYPLGMTTLATALQSVGYDTGLTGKWHLGSKPEWGPNHFGFTRSYGALAGGVDQYLHLYKKGPYQQTWHRNEQFVTEEGHATDLFAREAIRWIEADRGGKPFYIQAAFTAVHIPIQEPEEWVKPYEATISDPSRRRFAACLTHLDHQIGEMVAALKRTNQFENTLIIFSSDNGGSGPWDANDKYPGTYEPCPVLGLNHPLRGRKGQVYEGGVRVPAFIHWPGKIPSGVMDQPMHMIDWMPTLCGLTGATVADPKWDGRDVWPLFDGKTKAEPRTLYWKIGGARALRDGNWKLVVSGKKTELFDLAKDPNEATNVAAENGEVVTRLQALLEQEMAKDGPKTLQK